MSYVYYGSDVSIHFRQHANLSMCTIRVARGVFNYNTHSIQHSVEYVTSDFFFIILKTIAFMILTSVHNICIMCTVCS